MLQNRLDAVITTFGPKQKNQNFLSKREELDFLADDKGVITLLYETYPSGV
jgi:hypothetical protein